MTSSHDGDDSQSKKRPSQPFPWLMTQEHNILTAASENGLVSGRAKEAVSQKSRFRPFTQVDFPSFTQLVADEENCFAIPDPYKPLSKPRNPLELSELSWKVIQVLPEKTDILNNLVKVLENTHVLMQRGKFEIFLKQNLECAPYKKTFLVTCPLITVDESSSSDSSSQESSESDNMSTDRNESQAVSQNSDGPMEPFKETPVADISNDLDISSSSGSEDEEAQISASSTDIVRANKFPSPELPSESQTESKFITADMPNIDEFVTVGTQTDLSMEDIEKLTRRRAAKDESQVKAVSGAVAGDQQQRAKRRKKSIIRIGLPKRLKKNK
jgi:hypothetical protein